MSRFDIYIKRIESLDLTACEEAKDDPSLSPGEKAAIIIQTRVVCKEFNNLSVYAHLA